MVNSRLFSFLAIISIITISARCKKESPQASKGPCRNEIKLQWDSSYSESALNLDSLIQSSNFFNFLQQYPAYSTFELRTYHNQLFFNTDFPEGCFKIKSRNIIDLFISKDSLLWNNEQITIDSIQSKWLKNVRNIGRDPDLSDSPVDLLIVLSFSEKSPKQLLTVIDRIRTSHLALLDWYSIRSFSKRFCKLNSHEFLQVIESFPLNMKFAHPESFFYRRTNSKPSPPHPAN